MPVSIDKPDALDKMAQVEGSDYPELQKKYKEHSFDVFKKFWEKLAKEQPERIVSKPTTISPTVRASTIYGWHGWNRYVLLNTGEIMFHPVAARSKEDIKKAKKAGFRMFPRDFKK